MSFFKLLTWDNSHMNLKYVKAHDTSGIRITNVYRGKGHVNLDEVNHKYAQEVKETQRNISMARMIMLILLIAVVLLPALIISALQSNFLLAGGALLYTLLAYFIVECFIQVMMNRVLVRIDHDFHNQYYNTNQNNTHRTEVHA